MIRTLDPKTEQPGFHEKQAHDSPLCHTECAVDADLPPPLRHNKGNRVVDQEYPDK